MSIRSVSFHSWLLLTQSPHKFKMAVFWDTVDEYVLMMEAGSSFERSDHICQTKCRPVPEDRLYSHLHENLKCHQCCSLFNNFFPSFSFSLPHPPSLSLSLTCTNVWKYFRHFSSHCFFKLSSQITHRNDSFAKLREATISFVVSVCPQATTPLIPDGFSFNLIGDDFSKICC